jgi:hypothetical protein
MLKQASKISVPVHGLQSLCTLKSFAILLATLLLGTNLGIYKAFKQDAMAAFEAHQPAVETYVLSLTGKPVYTEII